MRGRVCLKNALRERNPRQTAGSGVEATRAPALLAKRIGLQSGGPLSSQQPNFGFIVPNAMGEKYATEGL